MELVTILRDLWRLRHLVICAALVAALVGIAVAYSVSFPPKLQSRKYEVGVATARILVDTPSSQVVAVAPKGSDTLGVRANLLASLMVDGVVKTAIARRAGLRPDQLDGVVGSDGEKPPSGPGVNVLTTRVMTNTVGDELPIIEIDTQSPDAASAARLANAAVAGLRDYLDSQAAVERVSDGRRLRVSGLGAAQAHMAARGPKDVFALAAFIFVFAAGSMVILSAIALVRGWRAAVQDEELEAGDLLPDDRFDQPRESAAETPEALGERSWGTPRRPTLAASASPDDGSATTGGEARAKGESGWLRGVREPRSGSVGRERS